MKDINSLKEREQQILRYMIKEIRENGYPPTVREICSAVGIKSTSTAHGDINNLIKAGFIKKNPAKPRTLVLVDDSLLELSNSPVPEETQPQVNPAEREDVVDIPVIGRVAAGEPILSEQNIEDTFPVPARFVKGNTFMLRVRGESMINVGIMDGDLILVEEQNTARNGEIVVAMVDGFETEATVKTFYRENDHIRLQPENDTMSPIIVKDVRIAGKVKGVFRYFS